MLHVANLGELTRWIGPGVDHFQIAQFAIDRRQYTVVLVSWHDQLLNLLSIEFYSLKSNQLGSTQPDDEEKSENVHFSCLISLLQ